jgi:hypothetical protein
VKQVDCCESIKLPDCIQKQIDLMGDAPPFISVKMQKVNGEYHYWLNTNARNYYGGVEYIVDSKCDTVCAYYGCYPPKCSNDHPFDKWETIWPQ